MDISLINLFLAFIGTVVAILMLFGGVPKIRKWLKPKPSLIVTESLIRGNSFRVNIKNKGNATAMDVGLRWTLHKPKTTDVICESRMAIPNIGNIPPTKEKPYHCKLPVQFVGKLPAIGLSIRLYSSLAFVKEEQITLKKIEENTHYLYRRPSREVYPINRVYLTS